MNEHHPIPRVGYIFGQMNGGMYFKIYDAVGGGWTVDRPLWQSTLISPPQPPL